MANRKRLCSTIIGLVIAILLELFLCKKIPIEFPFILISGLMYWSSFMVEVEAIWDLIKKSHIRKNILIVEWMTSGQILITTLLLGRAPVDHKSILVIVFGLALAIFVILGAYRIEAEKRY